MNRPGLGLAARSRPALVGHLTEVEFDLCVVGGGITGAGVARDAASRGMRVALIEMGDFASGTSSRSSKLIHGGIRYLENREFGLVFEALSERQRLFEMAPHLVHPLRFVLPVYESSRVGMMQLGLGMWLYDALALFSAPALHERLNPQETLARVPHLLAQKLCGSYVYSDAYMDDDRLVLETLRSAAADGAICVNYIAAKGSQIVDGRIAAIECEDRRSGKKFWLRARHFVSCAGPWTDQVAGHLTTKWHKRLRPTKGVHLTFRRERWALNDAVVMAVEKENRIVFAIPRHEMVILGTTDTDYRDDPAQVRTTEADVDYLLHVANHYFPGARLKLSDIVASYAGVRPLVHDDSATASQTSREHLIIDDPAGLTVVTGGKYTTYRRMAEQTLAVVLRSFPIEDQVRFGRSQTKAPLNPLVTVESLQAARLEVDSWASEFSLPLDLVEKLVETHGPETRDLLQRHQTSTHDLTSDWVSAGKRWSIELDYALEHSMCLDLIDFYLRRAPLFLAERDHGWRWIDSLSKQMAERLGWSDAERSRQVSLLENHLHYELGWRDASDAKTE